MITQLRQQAIQLAHDNDAHVKWAADQIVEKMSQDDLLKIARTTTRFEKSYQRRVRKNGHFSHEMWNDNTWKGVKMAIAQMIYMENGRIISI